MDLDQFLTQKAVRCTHVYEPGLEYYVRKSHWFPGLVELASVVARPGGPVAAYWRFLKKYEHRVPFMAEQVFNAGLAQLYRRRGWREWTCYGTPQFVNPLAVQLWGGQPDFERFCAVRENVLTRL